MKTIGKDRRIALTAMVLTLAVFLMAGCTNPVADVLNADEWGLVGTWVHAGGFGSSPNDCAKLVLNKDGTFKSSDTGGGMFDNGTFEVESVSVKENTRTYHIHFAWGGGSIDSYQLAIITDSTDYELNWTDFKPYPSTAKPGDMNYFKFTRD